MSDHDTGPAELDVDLSMPSDPTTAEAINARLDRGALRMDRFEKALQLNTDMTVDLEAAMQRNTDMTSEVYEVIVAARSFFAFLARIGRALAWVGEWILRIIKPIGAIAAALMAIYLFIYAVFHHGAAPK